ncbi:alpha/beta hydrolase domain-containing protein [Paenarthrobacter sp. RAF54_2]
MLRHTHPSRATGPLVFYDTNSIPHQPRRASLSQRRSPRRNRTRIVVRRPADPAEFNGALIVHWTSVSPRLRRRRRTRGHSRRIRHRQCSRRRA